MTTALLLLLVLVELARLVLQYWSAKTYKKREEKTYCDAVEVKNIKSKVAECDLQHELDSMADMGYQIAAVSYSGFNKADNKHYYTLFFTRKKIKNFTEK